MSVERSKWYQGFYDPGTREAREGQGWLRIQTDDARGFRTPSRPTSATNPCLRILASLVATRRPGVERLANMALTRSCQVR